MKKFPFQKVFITLILILIAFTAVIYLFAQIIIPHVRDVFSNENTTVVDFHTHFLLDPDVTQLVFDGQRLRDISPPLVEYRDGVPHVYLHAGFLRDHVDPFVFWDEGAEVLFVSTLYEMLEFTPDSEFFLMNGSPRPLEDAIIERDGDVFVPVSLVHGLYPLNVEYLPEYNIVVIISLQQAQTTATVAVNRANIRYWPANNAPITVQLTHGEELVLFLGEDFGEDGYTGDSDPDYVRVRTAAGLLGYVLISEIEGLSATIPGDSLRRETVLRDFIDNTIHHPRVWTGGTVNLIWESVYVADANRQLMQTPFHPSLTAVSPTWFRIDEAGTHLNSVASREYVDWAHSQDVLVWPLVFDVERERARLFLTDRNARRHAINQLIEFVEIYNFDGINIDFEHLFAADLGPYKIQFLRELAIPMRQRGIVLSAAVKVPLPETTFYRRDLIGKTVDFVMVMAYDEHWATSDVAGPVASLPWVRRGVNNMLHGISPEIGVPSERLILGMPFYNRVWREVVSTGAVSQRALGTNTTRTFFEERGVQWVWDFEIGSYFGEVADFEDGETVIYRVWLEDARSIQEKMHIFEDNNLAGVAVWSRLFSIDEFWEVLQNYF